MTRAPGPPKRSDPPSAPAPLNPTERYRRRTLGSAYLAIILSIISFALAVYALWSRQP